MKLKSLSLAILSASLLNGCQSTDSIEAIAEQSLCFDDAGQVIECSSLTQPMAATPTHPNSVYQPVKLEDPSLFNPKLNFVLLNEYVEQMAMDLHHNLQGQMITPVAITSFVTLDSTLKNASLLGNQLSEYFITELKNVGIPVSEHKVTGAIEVTPNGDFAMSRDLYELNPELDINYVLTGTLIENKRGTVINARVVSLQDNSVVASATKLVPNLVWQ